MRQKAAPTVVDSLLEAYKQEQNSEVRDDITAALTATKDVATIKRFSELIKDSSVVRPQDFLHWFVWLLRNRYGREYMWQWTRDEWQWLKKTFVGDSHYDMLPRYIASSLVTTTQLEEFISFFEPLKNDVALERTITVGETELRAKVALITRDGALVRKRLVEL